MINSLVINIIKLLKNYLQIVSPSLHVLNHLNLHTKIVLKGVGVYSEQYAAKTSQSNIDFFLYVSHY